MVGRGRRKERFDRGKWEREGKGEGLSRGGGGTMEGKGWDDGV